MKKGNKSHYLAKISLGVMSAGFLITIPFQETIMGRLLQGGFEAGLVGGLADWFAVTALFRHPMGIPIPHTALLPKNRDRMITALISMLEKDWLTKESIKEKIKQINFTDKLIQIAEIELASVTLKRRISLILNEIISFVNIEKIAPFIEKELKKHLHTLKVEKILESIITQALNRKLDEKALNYILTEIEKWMSKEETKRKIGIMAKQILDNIEADGFLKVAISSFRNLITEEKLGNMLQPYMLKSIILLQREDNLYRHLILSRIREELEGMQDKEELMVEINNSKKILVNNWSPVDQITEILKQLQNKLLLLAEDEEFIDRYVISFIQNYINSIVKTPEKMESIENWIQNQILYYLDKNHSKIGVLVKENLEKLDNETLINMMENNIGKDLQWIRVNGAICGFSIGIILTILKSIV
ncbi:DUF445 domain-containing protein [Lysinibacillus xylanilyticus]|uniref:DUF445 domain-containing protein n=1 Tax=Lysinibacillus xylanilyticus TaxID=582475 RepID=A0A2M9Q983_9BACI|nr:DUF445 domain-containing protein [Lysinibacillus xylanilyticus]PJO44572.1 DUF445 domain-containing protein [Lysinibacillus xylanilyticus]